VRKRSTRGSKRPSGAPPRQMRQRLWQPPRAGTPPTSAPRARRCGGCGRRALALLDAGAVVTVSRHARLSRLDNVAQLQAQLCLVQAPFAGTL